ncbi:MAG: hypothetical protein ACLPSL_10730 [Smithella sp.]
MCKCFPGKNFQFCFFSGLAQSVNQMTTNSIIPMPGLYAVIAHNHMVRISGQVTPSPQRQSIPDGCRGIISK